MVLKRIGPLSVAKILAAVYACIGLIIGCLLALISLIGAGLAGEGDPAWVGAILGVGAVVFLPVFYGVIGFIAGAIMASLYNLFAGIIGGVSVELE